jgi:hypothetical protein
MGIIHNIGNKVSLRRGCCRSPEYTCRDGARLRRWKAGGRDRLCDFPRRLDSPIRGARKRLDKCPLWRRDCLKRAHVIDRDGVEQHGDESIGLGEIGGNTRTKPISVSPNPMPLRIRCYPCGSVPTSVKNGAPPPIPGAAVGSAQPDTTDVRSGALAGCDLAPSAAGTAKWRFRPWKKRHLAPFSSTFLTIFSGFFCELSHQGADWRPCGPEKR